VKRFDVVSVQLKIFCVLSQGFGRILRPLRMTDEQEPSTYDPARTYDDAMNLLFAESQGSKCRGIFRLILLVCDKQ
jgi:hypothetical protein